MVILIFRIEQTKCRNQGKVVFSMSEKTNSKFGIHLKSLMLFIDRMGHILVNKSHKRLNAQISFF